jgi:hypothetical protein
MAVSECYVWKARNLLCQITRDYDLKISAMKTKEKAFRRTKLAGTKTVTEN